jgi:hypothetical protein
MLMSDARFDTAFDFSGGGVKYIPTTARRLANDAEMPNSDA